MTRSLMPDEVMQKMKRYLLSGEECHRMHVLQQDFLADIRAEFGASGLSHALLDPDEAFFIMENLNDWLRTAPHTQFRLRLVYRQEGGTEDVYTGRNTTPDEPPPIAEPSSLAVNRCLAPPRVSRWVGTAADPRKAVQALLHVFAYSNEIRRLQMTTQQVGIDRLIMLAQIEIEKKRAELFISDL